MGRDLPALVVWQDGREPACLKDAAHPSHLCGESGQAKTWHFSSGQSLPGNHFSSWARALSVLEKPWNKNQENWVIISLNELYFSSLVLSFPISMWEYQVPHRVVKGSLEIRKMKLKWKLQRSTQTQNRMEWHLRVLSPASTQIFAPEKVLHKKRVQASIKKIQELFVDAKPNVPCFGLTGEDRWVPLVFLNSQPCFPGALDNLSVWVGLVVILSPSVWSHPETAAHWGWPFWSLHTPQSHPGHVPSLGEKNC